MGSPLSQGMEWRKSAYSDGGEGCVWVRMPDSNTVQFRVGIQVVGVSIDDWGVLCSRVRRGGGSHDHALDAIRIENDGLYFRDLEERISSTKAEIQSFRSAIRGNEFDSSDQRNRAWVAWFAVMLAFALSVGLLVSGLATGESAWRVVLSLAGVFASITGGWLINRWFPLAGLPGKSG